MTALALRAGVHRDVVRRLSLGIRNLFMPRVLHNQPVLIAVEKIDACLSLILGDRKVRDWTHKFVRNDLPGVSGMRGM